MNVERLHRPAIWLDTNVFINIAAARTGAPQTPQDRDRAQAIDELVTTKVREQKLLCLGAGQHWEFYDEEPVRDAYEVMTLGADLSSTSTVQRRQLASAMKAYVDGMHEIVLPLGTFFDEDPITHVDRELQRPFFITTRISQGDYLRNLRELGKQATHRNVEDLRRSNNEAGVKFRQQLEAELAGRRAVLLNCIDDGMKALLDSRPADAKRTARERWLQAMLFVSDWTALTKRPPREFWEFLGSPQARAIPYDDIEARIYARLTTREVPVERGDAADIDYLALVLPVASYVVTDFAMMSVVRELGLDRKWRCEVYALRETDRLLEKVACL